MEVLAATCNSLQFSMTLDATKVFKNNSNQAQRYVASLVANQGWQTEASLVTKPGRVMGSCIVHPEVVKQKSNSSQPGEKTSSFLLACKASFFFLPSHHTFQLVISIQDEDRPILASLGPVATKPLPALPDAVIQAAAKTFGPLASSFFIGPAHCPLGDWVLLDRNAVEWSA